MRAAIYARYSSENQRPESIEDQIYSCRKFADERGFYVCEDHIYLDEAASGARKDRSGLRALMIGAETESFDVVLVDDLSRLARDNFLMLSILAEFRFNGIGILSVADGLNSEEEESNLGIQIRGIFNELQLRDLKKKTLRGQMGQKNRGFTVGERTFGYKSVPVGEFRIDRKGRPRPDGYKPVIEPREAALVLQVFQEYSAGKSLNCIVKTLNERNVPCRFRSSKGWSPATISRMLRNEKYVGKWTWNRTETRRDPKTGRRRQFPKPQTDWFVHHDETLRIVPGELWDKVQQRLAEMTRSWPGGKGKRGFESQVGGRVQHYPTHLLSGAMICGKCGASIAQVSGKGGGYYGCLAAAKKACDNHLLVRRTLCERLILEEVEDKLASAENLKYLFRRVESEVADLSSGMHELVSLKRRELESELRRVANFVDFIAEGRATKAIAEALASAEQRVDVLKDEITNLESGRNRVFKPPTPEWLMQRVGTIQEVLERRTYRSALILRKLLGTIRLVPTDAEDGRPYYTALSRLNVLPLLENDFSHDDSRGGSNSLHWWRRRESNSLLTLLNHDISICYLCIEVDCIHFASDTDFSVLSAETSSSVKRSHETPECILAIRMFGEFTTSFDRLDKID